MPDPMPELGKLITGSQSQDPVSSLDALITPLRQALQQTLSNQQPPNLASRVGLTGMGYSWQPQDASSQYPYVPPGVTQVQDTSSRTGLPPGNAAASSGLQPPQVPPPSEPAVPMGPPATPPPSPQSPLTDILRALQGPTYTSDTIPHGEPVQDTIAGNSKAMQDTSGVPDPGSVYSLEFWKKLLDIDQAQAGTK